MKCNKQYRLSYTEKASQIVEAMTLEEKVYLMSGNVTMEDMIKDMNENGKHYNYEPYHAGGNEKNAVPAMRFCDGPRGVVCSVGQSTCFPVSMNRGASFDEKLEEEIGKAIGKEIRAYGGNLFGGVCINLPYNPGWGRSQEVYGEESFALGKMGSALVRGVQAENVMACIKHYAFNSMEISRFKVSVDCERRTEREVYLPHFKDCIEAGAASVMSAYNLYKGTHCGHSDYLLRKVLKEEWDFDGFVMSDFIFGVRDTVEAANGGMDIEMCDTKYFGDKLVEAVQKGLVDIKRIDEAALRIVRTILAFDDAYAASGANYGPEVLGCEQHKKLALEAAQKGIVLLKNQNNVLPMDKKKSKSILVLGKLGNVANIGDHGSSWVFPSYTVTPLEGIMNASPDADVIYYNGENIEHAKKLAKQVDNVVFVVGYNHDDEGEYVTGDEFDSYTGGIGGDRKQTLGLHEDEVALIKQVGPQNSNSTVVLIGGNMIMITEWMDYVSSILMAFYPGQEGGTALAQILFGEVNPSAKLPFVLPYSEADLPQVNWDTTNQYYEYYHGYTKLDKEGVAPLLPYGFGLSYTSFNLFDAAFSYENGVVKASCTVQNIGKVYGAEVVQMYVGFENSQINRPKKLLRGFTRVALNPGETAQVEIACPVEKLQYYNVEKAEMQLESMEYSVYIGTAQADEYLTKGIITIK